MYIKFAYYLDCRDVSRGMYIKFAYYLGCRDVPPGMYRENDAYSAATEQGGKGAATVKQTVGVTRKRVTKR